jgi:hypothetical protein
MQHLTGESCHSPVHTKDVNMHLAHKKIMQAMNSGVGPVRRNAYDQTSNRRGMLVLHAGRLTEGGESNLFPS